METASQFKGAGMYTSAPGRGKILWTERSCRGGNLASSHSVNGASSGGLRVDSSTLGFNGGKSIWKVRDNLVALKFENFRVSICSWNVFVGAGRKLEENLEKTESSRRRWRIAWRVGGLSLRRRWSMAARRDGAGEKYFGRRGKIVGEVWTGLENMSSLFEHLFDEIVISVRTPELMSSARAGRTGPGNNSSAGFTSSLEVADGDSSVEGRMMTTGEAFAGLPRGSSVCKFIVKHSVFSLKS